MKRPKDRYRRVRRAIRKADLYRMKGKAREQFINKIITSCFREK